MLDFLSPVITDVFVEFFLLFHYNLKEKNINFSNYSCQKVVE